MNQLMPKNIFYISKLHCVVKNAQLHLILNTKIIVASTSILSFIISVCKDTEIICSIFLRKAYTLEYLERYKYVPIVCCWNKKWHISYEKTKKKMLSQNAIKSAN